MNTTRFLVLRTVVSVAALPATGLGAGYLMDPVVTYTNGMPLASSTSERSHNVYWQCDPARLGYCDGHIHSPCRNDIRALGTRHWGRFNPPYATTGPVDGQTEHLPDGLEHQTSEVIGAVSIDPSATRRPLPEPPAAAPSAGAPPSGGVWIDALQTLQRKMMIDPDKGY